MLKDRPPVTANLILPILIKPVLKKLESQSQEAASEIKMALLKAESAYPGLILEMVTNFSKHFDPDLDMTKTLLILQGAVPDSERENDELHMRANKLKKILSRIPAEINDRKVFLLTIKEVASAIKKLLDCLSVIIDSTDSLSRKQKLEERKREFIKSSKRFSNKLKEFFKEGRAQSVFTSAAHLINQTYAVELTYKY